MKKLQCITLFIVITIGISCSNPIDVKTFNADSSIHEKDIKNFYQSNSDKEKYLFNYSEMERVFEYITSHYLSSDSKEMTKDAKLAALNYCHSNVAVMALMEKDKNYGIGGNKSVFLYPKLLSYVRKEILKNPQEHVFYALSGVIKLDQNDYQGMLEDYNSAIALDPKNADYYYNQSIALSELGRNAEACSALRMAQNLGKQVLASEFKFCK